MTRRITSYAAAGVLMLLAVLPLLAARPASAAQQITIDITASGPKPALVTAAAGDTVVFRNADMTFVHQVKSESPNWSFNTGPLPPGATSRAVKLGGAGDYLYMGANLDSFHGKVSVPAAPGASPTASPQPTSASSPASSPAASPSAGAAGPSASPVASPTAGTGVVAPPPLAGGSFGLPSAQPGAPLPAPAVAPTLAGEDPVASGSPQPVVAVGLGRLPEPPTGRRYGLPSTLAAVVALGVGSLLVRLLLAHPAARRRRPAAAATDLPPGASWQG